MKFSYKIKEDNIVLKKGENSIELTWKEILPLAEELSSLLEYKKYESAAEEYVIEKVKSGDIEKEAAKNPQLIKDLTEELMEELECEQSSWEDHFLDLDERFDTILDERLCLDDYIEDEDEEYDDEDEEYDDEDDDKDL